MSMPTATNAGRKTSTPRTGPEVEPTPRPSAENRAYWIARTAAAQLLGIDIRALHSVAVAGGCRVKELAGVSGKRYFLPDIERIAREAVAPAKPVATAKKKGAPGKRR